MEDDIWIANLSGDLILFVCIQNKKKENIHKETGLIEASVKRLEHLAGGLPFIPAKSAIRGWNGRLGW